MGGGLQTEPRFEILLKTFLRFQDISDDDDWASWKLLGEKSGEKRAGGFVDAGTGQQSPILQALRKGLHGGILRDLSE